MDDAHILHALWCRLWPFALVALALGYTLLVSWFKMQLLSGKPPAQMVRLLTPKETDAKAKTQDRAQAAPTARPPSSSETRDYGDCAAEVY